MESSVRLDLYDVIEKELDIRNEAEGDFSGRLVYLESYEKIPEMLIGRRITDETEPWVPFYTKAEGIVVSEIPAGLIAETEYEGKHHAAIYLR